LAAHPDQPPSFKGNPPLLEFEQCENPFRDLLSVEPIIQRNGKVSIPKGPGLGIEINRHILDQYRVA
jgi:D-galactarolactone cycloisomerase